VKEDRDHGPLAGDATVLDRGARRDLAKLLLRSCGHRRRRPWMPDQVRWIPSRRSDRRVEPTFPRPVAAGIELRNRLAAARRSRSGRSTPLDSTQGEAWQVMVEASICGTDTTLAQDIVSRATSRGAPPANDDASGCANARDRALNRLIAVGPARAAPSAWWHQAPSQRQYFADHSDASLHLGHRQLEMVGANRRST
jgi:hypothetical protein